MRGRAVRGGDVAQERRDSRLVKPRTFVVLARESEHRALPAPAMEIRRFKLRA